MSTVAKSEFPAKKKLRDGMIKSRKTRTGDLIIAGICFLLMLLCLLPMTCLSGPRAGTSKHTKPC